MKTAGCSDAQIMDILKQAEGGVPVSELCREHGMSSASFYKWWARFGGMDASLIAEMKDIVQLAFHSDRQAFPAVLIQNVQGPERLPIIRPMMNEVIRPNMVTILWPQSNTCAIIRPESPFLGLLAWRFEPLAPP